MATLTVTDISRSGVNLTDLLTAAASGGDDFTNDGMTFLAIKNAHASAARTLTLDIEQTVDGATVTDPTVSITAVKTFIIGPFKRSVYNDTNGRMSVTYSDSAADLTVVPFRLTPE